LYRFGDIISAQKIKEVTWPRTQPFGDVAPKFKNMSRDPEHTSFRGGLSSVD